MNTLVIHQPTETILDAPVFTEDTGRWMDWIEAYHAWLESKRRRSGGGNTVKTYETAWKQFFRFAQVQPWEVTPALAQRWVVFLTQQGKETKDRTAGAIIKRQGLSASSVNLKLAALSSFYRFAIKNYDLWPANKRNPFDGVERNKISPYGRAKYPTVDEAKAILSVINIDTLTGKRDFALLFTILVTCRRSSEVLNIKWGDLQEIAGGDRSFTYRYKGGATKKAVLNRTAFGAIRAYLQADGRWGQMESADYLFTAIDAERAARLPHITSSMANQPLTNSMANKILKKYARRAGIDPAKAHVHGLRHAGARLRVQLMRDGKGTVDFEEIMHLLGHSSLSVTQIYATTILDDPVDTGAQAAAEELLPKGSRKRRKNQPPAEQKPLF